MDARRFDSLVRSISEGVLAPDGWQPVLAALRLELGCEQSAYLVHDRGSQQTLIAEVAQLDLDFVRQYETRYVALDPVRPVADAMPEGEWFIDERELGASTKRHSEFYQDFLRPYGLGAIICTPLINAGPTLAGLAFQSHLSDREPGTAKARRLQPLIPHLRCAARLRARFSELARHGDLGLLRELYGLSKAEVRLVLAWSAGGSLVDAAACLDISPETARTQLKSVFRKTGCASQTALTRLVSSLDLLA
ncbi:helix-turn-helix transcriptional regulator [Massilia sp. 2TAF26]|uniref:helix-turn-helix transcriptional regulator n=1 Tax=Massilia sp. 2TAF26 TaxID=3233012 RepID=UPI003F9828C1